MTDSLDFPREDFRAAATAFSQVSGVLGGFSITILVLVLSPEFLKEHISSKDWDIGILLLAACFYIASASILANSMNALVLKRTELRKQAFFFGIFLFHVANILMGSALSIIIYWSSRAVGLIALCAVGGIILFIAIANFGIALGLWKPRSWRTDLDGNPNEKRDPARNTRDRATPSKKT